MTCWFSRLAVAAAALAALAACRPEEQGRVMTYEKGTYRGPADTVLDDAMRTRLRERALLQSGIDGGAARPAAVGPGVRPPVPASG